jgi:hypothetical protein
VTVLFSRDDGLVNSDACRDASALDKDNIAIREPHVLIARNSEVMSIVEVGSPVIAPVTSLSRYGCAVVSIEPANEMTRFGDVPRVRMWTKS